MTALTLADVQAEVNRRLTEQRASARQGTVVSVSVNAGIATVDVDGGRQPMPYVGDAPGVGFKVWVANLGDQPYCLGIVGRAALGTVNVAAAGNVIGVLGDDAVQYTLPYLGAAPAVAARVLIMWAGGGVAIGTPSQDPAGVVPVTPPTAGTGAVKTFTFNPIDSGNYFSGHWGSNGPDPYCSASNTGAFFYGASTIPSSIPDGAVFVPGSLQIRLVEIRNDFPSSLATLGYHNLTGKTGAPNPVSSVAISKGSGWKRLPDSWEDNLRLGSARGVAFDGGGYHIFRRAGVDGSGTLVGKWRV